MSFKNNLDTKWNSLKSLFYWVVIICHTLPCHSCIKMKWAIFSWATEYYKEQWFPVIQSSADYPPTCMNKVNYKCMEYIHLLNKTIWWLGSPFRIFAIFSFSNTLTPPQYSHTLRPWHGDAQIHQDNPMPTPLPIHNTYKQYNSWTYRVFLYQSFDVTT